MFGLGGVYIFYLARSAACRRQRLSWLHVATYAHNVVKVFDYLLVVFHSDYQKVVAAKVGSDAVHRQGHES
jgi:hypothetical protein